MINNKIKLHILGVPMSKLDSRLMSTFSFLIMDSLIGIDIKIHAVNIKYVRC